MARLVQQRDHFGAIHFKLPLVKIGLESGIQTLAVRQQGRAQAFDTGNALGSARAAPGKRRGLLQFKYTVNGRVIGF